VKRAYLQTILICIAGGLFGFTLFSAHIKPTNTPFQAYLFDEGTGTNTAELVGRTSLDGELRDGVGWITNTPFPYSGSSSNYAVSLDGLNDYIQAEAGGFTKDNEDFTFSAWVYGKGLSGLQVIWTRNSTSGGAGAVPLYINTDTNDGNQYWSFVGPFPSGYSLGGAQTNDWEHIMITYDASGSNLKSYIDGALVSNISEPDFGARDGDWFLGRFGGGNFFEGYFDEFAWWDVVLTADNAEWLFANSLSELLIPEPSDYAILLTMSLVLLGYWRKHYKKSESEKR